MVILVIRNLPNSYRTGEVITILDDESKLTEGVDKTLYENKNGAGTWDRRSVLVIITDRTVDSSEIQELIQEDETGANRRKRFVIPQDSSSPFYLELVEQAKISATYQMFESLII